MGIDFKIYAYEDDDLFEVLELSGKKALLLANWFYTFYHRENVNKMEECNEYISFYLEEISTIYEHLYSAIAGTTSLMPIYPLPSDSLFYIEPSSREYYQSISELRALFEERFYKDRTYKEDTIFFYNISW